MTVSPPIRIAAICGLVGALTIGGGLMLLGRHSDSAVTAPITVKPHSLRHATAPHRATAATRHHTRVTTRVTTVKAPAVKVRKIARPAIDTAALAAGLPPSLARALAQHPVVVVQIYDPQSEVDAIAYAEAQAGARQGNAAFLPLSVLGSDVDKLTEKFGEVLPDPGILVYTRPATLALRIDGFVDRDTVAQAAENARS